MSMKNSSVPSGAISCPGGEQSDALLADRRGEYDRLQQAYADLLAERDQIRKSARAMHARQQATFERELSQALIAVREQGDARLSRLQDEVRSLEVALEQAQVLRRHETDELARLIEDRDRSTAEREALAEHVARLEKVVETYVNSASWKITAPLRRIASVLRRGA
ncbi:hypothetical protein [Phaeobacter sp. JL2872]|jgi:chromosome segregation ATPase|uniref:hypothetical protein n=1 Tax=Phaeobacter sp. JL2872 TaxID=2461377 RepID=UPI001403AB50|nr:hypothetical protein [Phaeobacter sp. JL2872]MEE2635237.1 hypothetical protein [Pseudomonadota bacterium]